ncbi:GerAB/ArcD/ProY family transporter [Paenibacillus sp. R14(2021)]|uniref:GerAB/ArcD/ProY family transporter n=1 Tax=Paenibacillus sp. R14(2021) TaxID=2859228 RepID=UPI001C6116EF|nr:GerAB/ArcD/ProY family transporter [Paenibacillus sp. R14(2021)]
MKLTGMQLFWLLFAMQLGMTSLLTFSPAFEAAKQGAWISMLLATLIALAVTYIAAKLSLLYPEKTLIEYVPLIVGKWLGTLITFSYLAVWYAVAGIILREYADFVHLALFTSTPLWVIILFMLLVMVYNVQGGIHIVGRGSEIIGPFILFSILLITLLALNNLNPVRMLPLIPGNRVTPILKGSVGATSFLCESVIIVMLIAFKGAGKRIVPYVLWGVGLSSLFMIIGMINVMMVLGADIPAKLQYPIYTFLQYISVMDFIQNIDVLAVIVTIFSIFIKLSIYMFATSYGTAQLLRIKRWKRMLCVSAPILFVIAMLPKNIIQSQIYFPQFWMKYVMPIHLIGLPVLLLLIGLARTARSGATQAHNK